MLKDTGHRPAALRVVGHSVPCVEAHAKITSAALTLNLDCFKIASLVDIPPINAVQMEQPDPIGPCGAKALGEPPLVPVAAAIANAVNDGTGVSNRELSIAAENVLAALRAQ